MIIYTKSHLKEVCLHYTPRVQTILSRKFSPTNIRELIASATRCNSYAHICEELQAVPVVINYDEYKAKLFTQLSTKHKLTTTKEQEIELLSLFKEEPLSLLYAPECNFPVTDKTDWYIPSAESPLTQLKKNAIEFVNLSKPGNEPKNEYPELYLDLEFDIDEAIDEYIFEHEDFGFSWEEDVESKGLSEEEGNKLYNKCRKKWFVDNKEKVEDIKLYALQQTAEWRYRSLISEGAIVENNTFKLNELDGHEEFKSLLFENFTKDCSLVFWRTVHVDTQFLENGGNLQGAFAGTQIVYLGVLDKGEFTPISSTSALSLNFEYTGSRALFDITDAHSACMNDVFKEMDKHITSQGNSWDNFIVEMSENSKAGIIRPWSEKNIFDNNSVHVFSITLLTSQLCPMIDDCCDDWWDFAETTGAPEVSESCIIFTEVCGPKPESNSVSIFSSYDFEDIDEEERTKMTENELIEQRKQNDFSNKLKQCVSDIDVVPYDPWAHPSS
jgi:hypothetical protein